MDPETLRDEVRKIRWQHTIDLGHGVVTPGLTRPSERLGLLGMPENLSGKTVLDIGAWDGFFAFEAERRGAQRVLAVDSFCWGGGGWGTKAGFDLARRALGSKVEDRILDVMDLAPETAGTFDLVLFLGVLYHMRHPLLALERVCSVTGDRLILETHIDLMGCRRPAMAFYPGDELNRDSSNWWGPNPAAVEAMLKAAGFRRVQAVTPVPSRFRRWTGALRHGVRRGEWFPPAVDQGRMVFHAWR